jgi:hypothetical protein
MATFVQLKLFTALDILEHDARDAKFDAAG